MARRTARPVAVREEVLAPERLECPVCGRRMPLKYDNHRRLETLTGRVQLRLKIRRCMNPRCARYRKPYRPEAEGQLALPQHEFGLDVIAQIGAWRYSEHRSVPEMHRHLTQAGLSICERSVTGLLHCYDELVTLHLTTERRAKLAAQGRIILAIDGLQPHKGHETLWVLRDCLSGEVLRARSLLVSSASDLVPVLAEVVTEMHALSIPIVAVVSDGQATIRNAVAEVLSGVPHQLCHFHYVREAAKPLVEADRQAKVDLKKHVRGIRRVERKVADRQDEEADIIQGYCAAARRSLTAESQPPLGAPGLQVHDNLTEIVASLTRAEEKGGPARRADRDPRPDHPCVGHHSRPVAGPEGSLPMDLLPHAHPRQRRQFPG